MPALDTALGIYSAYCGELHHSLAAPKVFASRTTVVDSALDGLGMGLGFTLTLLVMGSVRELLGGRHTVQRAP